MLRAWKIGRFFGINLYLHWSFLLLPLFAIWNQGDNSPISIPMLLGLLFSLFGCVVLHEYGHALTARHFGIGTRDITLYPIGGVARLERMSEKPWEEFWIAVGGPAVNVAIAILVALLLMLIYFCISPEALFTPTDNGIEPTTLGIFLMFLLGENVILFLFNMAPAFPMDGGRVFRALLSMWVGHLQATRIAARVGVVVAIVGGALLAFAMQSILILFVAFFVLFAGQQELRFVEWRHRRELDEEEPLPVLAVRQPYFATRPGQARPLQPQANVPLNGFLFQPRVAVYVWNNETGTWVKEAGPRMPPSWNEG